MASECTQLHSKGISHGDFGAMMLILFLLTILSACLIEDILSLVSENDINKELRNKWQKLITDCTVLNVKGRPCFFDVLEVLNEF